METRYGIRQFRDRARIHTQAELGEMLGVGAGNVSKWEAGKGAPSFSVARKLLELGATVEEVFGVEYAKMHGYLDAGPADLAQALRDIESRVAAIESKL